MLVALGGARREAPSGRAPDQRADPPPGARPARHRRGAAGRRLEARGRGVPGAGRPSHLRPAPTRGVCGSRAVCYRACRRGDLNPHEVALTSPSSWRVCLFRHSDVGCDPIAGSPEPCQRVAPYDWALGLSGGTRRAQFCVCHRSDGPLALGETPDVSPDHASRLGSANSGRATICCQSAASTWV